MASAGVTSAAGALVAYIRVSTAAQSYDAQLDALRPLDPVRIFDDTMSGTRADRPGFRAMLDYVRPGDTVAVIGFDRFGRNTATVFSTLADLTARGIHVRGLREQVDTSTPAGRMVAGLFVVIAEYERELILERSQAAREAARARGVAPGRPRALDADAVRQMAALRGAGESVPALARRFGVSRSTAFATLARVASP